MASILASTLVFRAAAGQRTVEFETRIDPEAMPSVLLTAFEPYDCWEANSSWLALVELTKDLPSEPQVTTRRYPVDFAAVREKLAADLTAEFDFAIHLGQSPGSARIALESIGVNIGGASSQHPDEYRPLVEDGPVAYRSALPLADWAAQLRGAGIPAAVSYNAGAYLCNATLYLSHHYAQQQGLKTKAAFVHLPLETSQANSSGRDLPSLPVSLTAAAIRHILAALAQLERSTKEV